MSTITNTATVHAGEAFERRARASIAFGRKRGYYRVLFESGPVDAATFAVLAGVPEPTPMPGWRSSSRRGLLRVVDAPDGAHEELLLPGEYVPILLGDRGEPELDGARRLLEQHRDELPPALAGVVRASARAPRLGACSPRTRSSATRSTTARPSRGRPSGRGRRSSSAAGGRATSSSTGASAEVPAVRRGARPSTAPSSATTAPAPGVSDRGAHRPRARSTRSSRRSRPSSTRRHRARSRSSARRRAAAWPRCTRLGTPSASIDSCSTAPTPAASTSLRRRSRGHAVDHRPALGPRLPGPGGPVPPRRDGRRARRVRRVPAALGLARGRARVAPRGVRLRLHRAPRRRARPHARAAPPRRPCDPVRARQGASRGRIRNARFVALEGVDHFPWRGDADAVVRETLVFLGAPVEASHPPRRARPEARPVPRRLTDREREVLRLVARGETRCRDRRAARALDAHRAPPHREHPHEARRSLAHRRGRVGAPQRAHLAVLRERHVTAAIGCPRAGRFRPRRVGRIRAIRRAGHRR